MIGSHPVKVITAYNQNEEATGEQGADQSRSIYANYTNTDLYKALKPFLTNLQLVGLHHKKEYQLDKCISKDSGQRKCRLALTPSQVYSFIISLLVTLNTFRYFYTFKDDNSFGTTLLDKLLYIGWNLLCTTKILACFRASHKYTCLPEFFLEWEKIHANDKDCVNLKFCRRSAYIYSITCWTLVTVNVGVSVYAIYFTDAYDSWLTPFSKKDSFIHYWYIYQIIITFYSNTVWIFPMALQYMICKILYVEFKRFNKCFKKRLVENGCEMLEEFEDMRQKHQSLCKLVNHADDFLSLYNGGVVAFALLGICINLYNLIWYEEVRQDFFAVFVPLFWLTAITVELGFVCIGGILINTKAHDVQGMLYDIHLTALRTEKYQQLQQFLSRVSNTQIGLTALKMFVIDKNATLTLIGLLISYFIIIVQFSSAPSTQTTCNCTEVLNNQTFHCFIK